MSTAITDAELRAAVVEVFTAQIATWRAAGRPGVPLLVLADVLPPARGRCVSCGIRAETWRCAECLTGVELALELADLEGQRLVPPLPILDPIHLEIEDAARERDLWRGATHGVDELSPALRRLLIHEGRKALERPEPLRKGPTLMQDEVAYTFADVSVQIARGIDPVCCGRCTHFAPPPTPSGVGACRIVVGPVKGTDQCNRFKRKAAR